ncbi:hypothetical protein M0R45_024502 [Rubus argutus]|uniref:Serine aminopeptidase S33 domain-containing protein n=1 Tax=Rubus argutus TaxID=59490 RepID=A0AAW1WUI3_RUBAR
MVRKFHCSWPKWASATETPPNFWGDMPAEEYYSFLPLDPHLQVKATVFMTHGYGSDTGWLFQKICISFSTWGYAVFATDLLGHGRSDGLRCYLGDMEKVAATSLSYFLHIRRSEPYRHLPAFLYGESLGGTASMLMYFQSDPDTWTGLIFSAPLFVIPENMRASKLHLFV